MDKKLNKFINADDLVKKLFELRRGYKHTKEICAVGGCIVEVQEFPPSDVREVVHAEWVDKYGDKYDNHFYVCSNCGEKALYDFKYNELDQTKVSQKLTLGCPHCLAIMDGGKKDV